MRCAAPVAAAAVWKWILNPNFGLATAIARRFGWEARWLQEGTGIFDLLGQVLHLPVPAWAAGPSLALVCIIVVSIWSTLGFAVVVLLAGLTAIPPEVTEAARLDGAQLRYADLRGADMRRAQLSNADFAYANLIEADLRDADLAGAVLAGTKVPALQSETLATMAMGGTA